MIYDDTPQTKNTWTPNKKSGQTKHDPRIIEIVKFLARTSAERDYNNFTLQSDPSDEHR